MKKNKEEKNNQTQEKNIKLTKDIAKSEETSIEDENIKKEEKKKFNRKKLVIIITLIAVVVAGVIFRGNYLEMRELGAEYLNVFWRNTLYLTTTVLVNFIFLFCLFFFTNKAIRKGIKIFFDEEKKEIPKFPNKSISFIIALFGSIISSKILLNKILLCVSNSKFGITDPIYNLDISFLVFVRPLIEILLLYLIVAIIATIAYGLVYSIIILNISFDGVSRETLSKCKIVEIIGSRVKMLAVLAGLMVLFTMVANIGNEKFMGIELSEGEQYSIYGAGNADATVKLWGYALLAINTTYSILKAYKSLKEKNLRKVLGNIMIVPAYLIIFAGVMAVYQIIFIGTNRLAADEKYINNNIKFTKEAYKIAAEEQTIDYSGTITKNEIESNKNTLDNIDIVTSKNVLQDLQTSRTSKGYYTYRTTQIQKYNIDGKDTLVYITPREILNNNTTYSNKTYQYTHGYGSIVTLAGEVDEYGNLKTIQKEFDGLSRAKIPIIQPRIYYGLETNNTAVINTSEKEIDYIDEDSNNEISYNYGGNSGLKLNFIDRFILGIREGDFKIAFSGILTDESKIITNRNIVDRAKKVMPYLKYYEDPYMIIDDSGRQYWVLDGYTVSNYYPFSQKTTINGTEEINYIRNSVKVIINAYDGSMKFYITDRTDPIVMAYNSIYPTLFAKENDKIPEDISKHFVYPKKLFDIQSNLVEKYHSIKSEVLYRGNDVWEKSTTIASGKEEKVEAYYGLWKSSKLGIFMPYTDYKKENLRAYMVGTIENGNPKLEIYRFSSDSNVLGIERLETQINQDENIASEIAALNTTGTKITKKTIAIPINNTILYVETIYQQLVNESIQKPTLKKVVVASGNKVAIGNDLDEALDNLLSQYAVSIDIQNSGDMQGLVNSIIKANENVQNSSKNGDWKLFGEDMQRLNQLIKQLENITKQNQNKTTESNQVESNTINDVSTNVIE